MSQQTTQQTTQPPALTVLVAGATGTVGASLVGQLLDAGHRVLALTRDPDRALAAGRLPEHPRLAPVRGDLTDPTSLDAALDPALDAALGTTGGGIDAAHLITFDAGTGEGGCAPLQTGAELVALLRRRGVARVSVLGGWDEGGVEEALRAAGQPFAQLQPLQFMANDRDWLPQLPAGVVRQLADFPSSVVHEGDIAAVALAALTRDGLAVPHLISGPEALTTAERIATIAGVTGLPVRFERTPSADAERERLTAAGVDAGMVEFTIALATDPPEVADAHLDTVERVVGRPGLTYAQWVADHRDELVAAARG